MTRVAREVAAAARRLTAVYALELGCPPERFVVSPEFARRWLPRGGPRTGLLVVEEDYELWLALYVDPRDLADAGTIVEETSHLVCLAWHAAQGRPVSRLVLELQSEVDRYVLARLAGGDAFAHFERFAWRADMSASERQRYEAAHRAAHRYCRGLARRFPALADLPRLLVELRHFYRASPRAKLHRATA